MKATLDFCEIKNDKFFGFNAKSIYIRGMK